MTISGAKGLLELFTVESSIAYLGLFATDHDGKEVGECG